MTGISIKGLKISEALCLVRLHHSTPTTHRLPAFCRIMAGSLINLPYISQTCQSDGVQAACCAEAVNYPRIVQLMDTEPMMKGHVSYVPDVGLLTIFPHQSSLKLFLLTLHTLCKNNVRVLETGSSIGALTYVLPYAQLDEAADMIQARFQLDEHHSPFKADFVVCQSAQVRPDRLE